MTARQLEHYRRLRSVWAQRWFFTAMRAFLLARGEDGRLGW